jgi:hypothetical protein
LAVAWRLRARIIAEPLPGVKDRTFGCFCQDHKVRKTLKPVAIVPQDGSDLGLLKHEFGNENGVGISRSAPGKITPVIPVPFQNRTAKTVLICHVDRSRDSSGHVRNILEIPRLHSE